MTLALPFFFGVLSGFFLANSFRFRNVDRPLAVILATAGAGFLLAALAIAFL